MANTVKLKRSSVQGKVPTTGDLELGELALNTNDGVLFFKRDNGSESVVKVATTTNLLSYTRVTSNTAAVSRQSYIADTSGGTFTITLPSGPASGDWVTIADGASFQTTALTVGRNSSTIADIAENLSLNIEGVSVTFVYDGSTWEVFTQVGAQGGDAGSGDVTASSTTTFTNKTISGSTNTVTITDQANSATIAATTTATSDRIVLRNSSGYAFATYFNMNHAVDTARTTDTVFYSSDDDYIRKTNATSFRTSLNVPTRTGGDASGDWGINITGSAPAGSLTGTTLKSTVVNSSLTSVGTLTNVTVAGAASVTANSATDKYINVGTHGQLFDDGNFHIHATEGALWLNSLNGSEINLGLQSNSGTSVAKANSLHMNAGYGSIAPTFGVRAWISCGYVGGTMVTNGSGNLSVSRISAGKYQFTFGTAMPDGNYSVTCTAKTPVDDSDVAANIGYNTTTQTTGFIIHCARYGTGFLDVPQLCIQVVR